MVLLSNNESKNDEHSLLRGGSSSCDEPHKMVSPDLCDGTDGADKGWSISLSHILVASRR